MKSKSFTKKKRIMLFACLLGFALVTFIFYLESKKTQTVIYRNPDYLFQLSLPSDWETRSFTGKNDVPSFQITSSDKTITIQNYSPSKSNRGEDEFHTSSIKVGQYNEVRTKDLMEDGVTDDFVDLNIPKEPGFRLYFVFYEGDEEENAEILKILSTFSYYQERPSIDSLITYTIPVGYTKKIHDDTENISLESPGLQMEPYISQGALISISYTRVGKNAKLPPPYFSSDIVDKTTVDGSPASDIYSCYEGCFERYEVLRGNYVWEFGFASPAHSQKEIISDAHHKDFISFMQSVTFKK